MKDKMDKLSKIASVAGGSRDKTKSKELAALLEKTEMGKISVGEKKEAAKVQPQDLEPQKDQKKGRGVYTSVRIRIDVDEMLNYIATTFEITKDNVIKAMCYEGE